MAPTYWSLRLGSRRWPCGNVSPVTELGLQKWAGVAHTSIMAVRAASVAYGDHSRPPTSLVFAWIRRLIYPGPDGCQ
jgi:hypothetical protein